MKLKITGGTLKGRMIATPKGQQTRPTSERLRQTVFDILSGRIEASHFLDAFAGSGAIGIEALSRGAKSLTLIEQARPAIACIESNLKELGLSSRATLYRCDCIKALLALKNKHTFDLAYFDPPYPKSPKELEYLNHLFEVMDTSQLFADGALILFELPLNTSQINLDPHPHLMLEKSRKIGNTCLHQITYTEMKN
ncbi:MAG: 16S rRNA (guanine(966)-N(2))-methyltransferase RsmD [Simkaniaceae bacterium]|nr:16S rRNA (guanine(966)-N(2))-methyltransferase RsmD [Simkaniaceae bacterium]MCF7852759.1 16S rRNA (guanine(966)-N(2))-methyltransferase RsmD [Simkaniaceae bacterium]